MTNDILTSIVESYKQKGASNHDLLRDPLFLSLPLEKQVEAVQAYAGVLAQSGKPPSLGRIFTKSVLSGIVGGAFASLPFVAAATTGKGRALVATGGGIVGGIIGGLSGGSIYGSEKDRFEQTNKYLIRLTERSELPTAVKVLDINRKYEPRTISSIVRRLQSPETPLIEKAIGVSLKANEQKLKDIEGV